MCDPLTIATIGLTAGSAVAGHLQTNALAEAQTDAINTQLALEQEQIAEQTSREQSERAREARRERGRVLAAAAEAGVGGEAVIAQLRNSVFQAGFDISTHERNARERTRAARTSAESRVRQVQTSSLLDLGLGVGTAIAGGLTAGGRQPKPKGGKTTTKK